MLDRIKNIFYAVDLLIAAIFGFERHQTISAKWGTSSKVWLWYWGCRFLHILDPDHCEKSREHYEKIKAATGGK